MSLWAVLVTGLFAGGASCAAVQGGLLAGLVARRADQPAPAQGSAASPRSWNVMGGVDDVLPVGGFLAGKLASHVLLGAALGLVGSAVQMAPRTRATVQIMAGVVMLVLAIDLLGLNWFRRVTPTMPASWGQRVRRSSRSNAAMGPTVLGLASVALPCGITLSMEVLAVASGSALSGAAVMGVFVLGTAPLFAVLGYLARRSATALRGRLALLSGAAVLVTGLLSVNTGLVLLDSPLARRSPFSKDPLPVQAAAQPPSATATPAFPGPATPDPPVGTPGTAAPDPAAPEPPGGGSPQRLVVDVSDTAYSPSALAAKAGTPAQLVLRTNNTVGCTRALVVPKLNLEQILPKTGETVVELGTLKPGRLGFTCSMGMYSGYIEVS